MQSHGRGSHQGSSSAVQHTMKSGTIMEALGLLRRLFGRTWMVRHMPQRMVLSMSGSVIRGRVTIATFSSSTIDLNLVKWRIGQIERGSDAILFPIYEELATIKIIFISRNLELLIKSSVLTLDAASCGNVKTIGLSQKPRVPPKIVAPLSTTLRNKHNSFSTGS